EDITIDLRGDRQFGRSIAHDGSMLPRRSRYDRRRALSAMPGKIAEPGDQLPALAAAADPFQLRLFVPLFRPLGRRRQLDRRVWADLQQPLDRIPSRLV